MDGPREPAHDGTRRQAHDSAYRTAIPPLDEGDTKIRTQDCVESGKKRDNRKGKWDTMGKKRKEQKNKKRKRKKTVENGFVGLGRVGAPAVRLTFFSFSFSLSKLEECRLIRVGRWSIRMKCHIKGDIERRKTTPRSGSAQRTSYSTRPVGNMTKRKRKEKRKKKNEQEKKRGRRKGASWGGGGRKGRKSWPVQKQVGLGKDPIGSAWRY